MSMHFLSDEENLADLADRIPGRDRDTFRDFKALKIEAAFDDRIFVIYKPQGLTASNEHRDPLVLGTVRVKGFSFNAQAKILVEDDQTGQTMEVGYVPQRLFNYDVFVSVPPFMKLRWDARLRNGEVLRSLAYPILIKTRTRSDWYSAGVTHVETPNRFRDLFPRCELNFY